MLHPHTFSFLSELTSNNNKEWFDDNRKQYEDIRAQLMVTMQEFINSLSLLDSRIGNLAPKNCVFRINRDIRFSKNKNPYKNNMGGWFSGGHKNEGLSGYYLHIENNNSFIAAGNYMPMPDVLKKIRQEIDYNGAQLHKILEDKNFKKTFGTITNNDALKNIPKGYDANHEYGAYLKLKSFEVSTPYSNANMLHKNLINNAMVHYTTAHPYVSFLNTVFE
jgi:uncharacterized protein (TIGR02453 family)